MADDSLRLTQADAGELEEGSPAERNQGLLHLRRQLARARERYRHERTQHEKSLAHCERLRHERDELAARHESLGQAHAAVVQERDTVGATLRQIYSSRGWRTVHWVRQFAKRLLWPLLWCRNRLGRRPPVIVVAPSRAVETVAATIPPSLPALPDLPGPDLAGCPRVAPRSLFRVLFVLRPGVYDAACMRYRGYNVIEALRLRGIEAAPLDERQLPQRLNEALTYDLIVLVRRRMIPEIELLLERAMAASIPVICDLDDLLFDEGIIPLTPLFRELPIEQARAWLSPWREVPLRCAYFTGATPYLVDRAAALGKRSYHIPNGVNLAQLELSRQALENTWAGPGRAALRLGYFSGTLTHQGDFRLIVPALLRLLDEFPEVHLLVTGDFDLTEFPEFAPFAERVEGRPFVEWPLLPAEIARADVNLIPLELNLFTHGKSNLKYYEAALLKIPSVATPAPVFTACIEPGINGFLAATPDEWYEALRTLIVEPRLRQEMGERAYQHALSEYVPGAIADAAMAAYRDILAHHRERQGVAADDLTAVVLLSDLERAVRDRSPALTLAVELVRLGTSVTIHLPHKTGFTAARADQFLADHYLEPLFAVQVGGEVPCCDLLLATDAPTAFRAKRHSHRAGQSAYLVTEYDPAAPSYELGLRLIAFDSVVAEPLARHHQAKVEMLPPWVEPRNLAAAPYLAPTELLVVAATGVAEHTWLEALAGLQRIHPACPEVRIVLCGAAAMRGHQAPFPHRQLPWLDGPEFDRILAGRPVVAALIPSGNPPWLYDLMAAGCPIVVASGRSESHTFQESVEGLIRVSEEGSALATAVESLLIDRGRLIALSQAALNRAQSMPNAVDVARLLLAAFREQDSPRMSIRSTGDRRAQIA